MYYLHLIYNTQELIDNIIYNDSNNVYNIYDV